VTSPKCHPPPPTRGHCSKYSLSYTFAGYTIQINEINTQYVLLGIENLYFGGKTRQINIQGENIGTWKIREIHSSQFIAACSGVRKKSILNIASILFYSFYPFIGHYSRDCHRFFCSYKREFYHERFSVSQKRG
jgi:hypothetical protein